MRRSSLMVLSAVTVLMPALFVSSAAAATSSSPPDSSTIVYGSSFSPISDHQSLSELNQMNATTDSQLKQMNSQTTTTQPDAFASPNSVASGYTLVGNKQDDYRYNSSAYYITASRCTNGGCTVLAEVKTSVKENVTGGSSKRWLLTENASTISNPGGISWYYTATYSCAVNVSNSPDHYCGNGADGSQSEAPMTPGEAVYKTFEKVNGNTVYPMVAINVHFSTGGGKSGLFREWDVCNRSTTTKLCASSGTGT